MTQLKLVALDEEDLAIISAHVQDAVLKVPDLAWRTGEKRFALAMNRFAWENRPRFFVKRNERRRSALHFDRVMSVTSTGIDRSKPETVLSLLALRFHPGEAPAGEIELVFSGDASIKLQVECIEARLTDLGAAWEASSRPSHES